LCVRLSAAALQPAAAAHPERFGALLTPAAAVRDAEGEDVGADAAGGGAYGLTRLPRDAIVQVRPRPPGSHPCQCLQPEKP